MFSNVNGLNLIEVIASRNLVIRDNSLLDNVDGLEALYKYRKIFIFRNNLTPDNLAGLSALETVGRDFIILDNYKLNNRWSFLSKINN